MQLDRLIAERWSWSKWCVVGSGHLETRRCEDGSGRWLYEVRCWSCGISETGDSQRPVSEAVCLTCGPTVHALAGTVGATASYQE